MSVHRCFALLIGVDDYSAYDASTGRPRGTSDLLGSRNDVAAFFRTCRAMEIPAENIRVLTSPRLDGAALPGALPENVGEATELGISRGAAWLAEAIRGANATGLLTFSGHGARLEGGGLAICPSDTRGTALSGAISFEALRAVFEARGALPGLTCVIDACFAGAAGAGEGEAAGEGAAARGEVRTLCLGDARGAVAGSGRVGGPVGGGAPGRGATAPAFDGRAVRGCLEVADRVLAASEPDRPAFQARFSGEHRGAFSWAVGAALDQWSRVRDEGGTRLSVSYGEVRARAERLLATLSFDQRPVLAGPPNVSELAFLQRGSVPRATSREPNAIRARLQIDPGNLDWRKYVLTVASSPSVVLAEVFAIHRTTGSFTAGNEYWNVNRDALASRGSYSISVAYTDHQGTTPAPTAFSNAQAFTQPIGLTWQRMTTDPGSGGSLHGSSADVFLRLVDDGQTPPSLTEVIWYQVLPDSGSPANIGPTGTFGVAGSVSVGSGEDAHYIQATI